MMTFFLVRIFLRGMRRPRVKVEGEGFYHVVSRIGGRRFLIDGKEKSVLLGMIRAAAAFSGVELYTYAVMSNHFHLLVRVPRRREVSDAELLRRMRALYGPARFAKVLEKWEKWAKRGQEARVEEEKAKRQAAKPAFAVDPDKVHPLDLRPFALWRHHRPQR